MSAGKYNLEIEQGVDFNLQLTINDSLGSPIDLTHHLFRGQIRKYISDVDIVANFSFTILDQITNKGSVIVFLPSGITTNFDLPIQKSVDRKIVNMAYDIESEASGIVFRWLEGQANISPEVTR